MNTKFLQSCTFLSALVLVPVAGFALPKGGSVVGGDPVATIVDTPNKTTITQISDKAIIDWESFNIAADETVRFKQDASDVALNRIDDTNPSKILGKLRADGTIMLVNPNGVMFGQNARVDVGNLVVSTANITDSQFENPTNGKYRFNIAGAADAKIVVRDGAKIRANVNGVEGGIVALVAPSVVNNGVIKANLGKVSLAGGEKFTIDLMGDGLVNLLPSPNSGKVKVGTTGKVIANGGAVLLTAKDAGAVLDGVINMQGIVRAETAVTGEDGRIILDASNAHITGAVHTKTIELHNDHLKVDKHGIDLVDEGGTVKLGRGTFTTDHTIEVDKEVTVQGSGKGNTTIDASGVDSGNGGIFVTADNTNLRGFTLKAPGQLAGIAAYGVSGLHLNNVEVDGGGSSLSDSSLTGIAIVDSNRVTLNNISTHGNLLAGVSLLALNGDVDKVTIGGTNSYGEDVALATVGLGGDVTRVSAHGMNYQTKSDSLAAALPLHIGLYHTDLDAAVDTALFVNNLPVGNDAVLEGLDNGARYLTGNNHFYVGNNGVAQMDIQAALNAVLDNGTVDVLNGTYTLGSTLTMHKSGVTLQGESRNGTILDASGLNGYGLLVDGDHSTLQKFTLLGGDNGSSNYGIKVQSAGATTDVNDPGYAQSVKDIDILNVIVKNFGRSEIDVNGAQNVDIKNVLADGNGTAGNGIAITDSHGVRLGGVITKNNGWGGVRVGAEGKWHTPGTSNVKLQGNNNHLREDNPFYTESVNGAVVSDISAPMFNYKLHSGLYDATKGPGVVQYLYQADLNDSVDFALNTMGTDATIEGLEENTGGWTVGNNTFYVGQSGGLEMNIQTAVNTAADGGTVNVLGGTYHLNGYPNHYLWLTKGVTLNGAGEGLTVLDGSDNSSYGIRVQADDVALNDFTLIGPHVQTPGRSQEYGVKAELGAGTGATLDRFAMNHVTVEGAGKTQVDVNQATFAVFNNVTVNGNGTRGNGFGITDAHDVTFNNVTANGNAWGDIRLTARNGDTDKVRLMGSNHLNGVNPMYTEQYAGHVVKDIYFPTMKFTVHSGMNDVAQGYTQTFYQTNEADALAFADGFIGGGATDAVVQGNARDSHSHNTGNNVFYVDGNMDIVSALAEAQTGGLIHLYNATYTVTSPLDLNGNAITFMGTGTQPVASGGTLVDASTLDDAFNNGTASISDLTLRLREATVTFDGLLVTRETTRQHGSFLITNNGIGGGDIFSLIEPAAGGDETAEKDDDVEHMPLQQEQLAVAQYFINTGNVVDQQYAIQALLAEATLNGK